MQTKRMLMTTALALSLMMTGCTGSDANIETEAANSSEVEQSVENEGPEAAGESIEASESQEDASSETAADEVESTENTSTEDSGSEESSKEADEETAESEAEPEYKLMTQDELDQIKPNELGEVMIVMYHGLGTKNSAYVRTPDSFRKDLETYYEMGFRPVNLTDYVNGNIDTEAGMTPIVLTFDDGNKSNFNIIEENGELKIDPDCAIGIIMDFSAKHPDWAPKGSFFLNGGTPFGQKEYVDYKVNWLVENGFEVGNHSYGHEDLTDQDAAGIQRALGKNIQEIESRIEGYTVNTLALPFGKRPKDQERYDLVTSGVFEGISYEHIAILLVGWKPEVAVFDKAFDPLAIMRVQSGDGDFQMIHWLEDYRNNPHKRFISDGNPNTVTVPEKVADRVNMELVGDKTLVSYTVSDKE